MGSTLTLRLRLSSSRRSRIRQYCSNDCRVTQAETGSMKKVRSKHSWPLFSVIFNRTIRTIHIDGRGLTKFCHFEFYACAIAQSEHRMLLKPLPQVVLNLQHWKLEGAWDEAKWSNHDLWIGTSKKGKLRSELVLLIPITWTSLCLVILWFKFSLATWDSDPQVLMCVWRKW